MALIERNQLASTEELQRMDSYWRACNYLAAGMIYLRANSLLREPLKPEHIKRRLLGHWGSDPGQSFIWVHLNRLIEKYGLNVLFVSGPGGEPDVVMACAGDVPTMESLAAVSILKEKFSDLKIRFINVVDLFRLMPASEHPHGLSDADFDSLFTTDKPVIFNFHSYASLVHKLSYRRRNHENIHVRGYKEKGSINTPFELAILNQIDRFDLVIDVIDRVPKLRSVGAHVKEEMKNRIIESIEYAHAEGIDPGEINNWTWKS
jgi:phosphoketolase